MKDFIFKIICKMGFHSWHYYSRYNGEDENGKNNPPIEARMCRHCRHSEYLGTIKIKHWENY